MHTSEDKEKREPLRSSGTQQPGLEPSTIKDSNNIIEEIIDRIGLGKYHWLNYLVFSIFWLCDGAEVIALSLLSYVLVNVTWFESPNNVSLLASGIFAGFFVGCLISGWLATAFGRKKPFLILLVLVFILGVLSAASPDLTILLVTRSIYGITVGILAPLSLSMVLEITPKAKRGISFVIISSFFTVGEIVAIFIGVGLKVEENPDGWRYLLVWASAPALVSFVLGLLFLQESPRYKLLKDTDEALEIFNGMNIVNNKAKLELSKEEHQQFIDYAELQKQANKDSPLKEIFSGKNLFTTINLWIGWFVLTFVYYGVVYILPLVMAKISVNEEGKLDIGYKDLLISVLGEVPSYILAMSIIERKKFGRKLSLIICFFCTGLCCLGVHFFVDTAFGAFVFATKLFASSAFEFIYPLTAELYNTSCRTVGVGLAGGVSRIGGVIMPWITMWALEIAPTGPFIVFGGLCFLAAFTSILLPYDTTGRELDKVERQTELIKSEIRQ